MASPGLRTRPHRLKSAIFNRSTAPLERRRESHAAALRSVCDTFHAAGRCDEHRIEKRICHKSYGEIQNTNDQARNGEEMFVLRDHISSDRNQQDRLNCKCDYVKSPAAFSQQPTRKPAGWRAKQAMEQCRRRRSHP